MENFRKLFEASAIACLLLHMFRHLGDLLTIKILKGGIKKKYCQDREILGFSENYLKLLQALYNCVANIRWTERENASCRPRHTCYLMYAAKISIKLDTSGAKDAIVKKLQDPLKRPVMKRYEKSSKNMQILLKNMVFGWTLPTTSRSFNMV